jgi:hypothetical protein
LAKAGLVRGGRDGTLIADAPAGSIGGADAMTEKQMIAGVIRDERVMKEPAVS